jgi:hypothetical protein
MWIDRPGGETLIVGSNRSNKYLRIFFGFECFGYARISSRTMIGFHGVGDIPALRFGHYLLALAAAKGKMSTQTKGRRRYMQIHFLPHQEDHLLRLVSMK